MGHHNNFVQANSAFVDGQWLTATDGQSFEVFGMR